MHSGVKSAITVICLALASGSHCLGVPDEQALILEERGLFLGNEQLTVAKNAFRWRLSLMNLTAVVKAPDYDHVVLMNTANNTYYRAPAEFWRQLFTIQSRAFDPKTMTVKYIKDEKIARFNTHMYEMTIPPTNMKALMRDHCKNGLGDSGIASLFERFESLQDPSAAANKQRLLVKVRFWVVDEIKPSPELLRVLTASTGIPCDRGLAVKVMQIFDDGSSRVIHEAVDISPTRSGQAFDIPADYREVTNETALLLDKPMSKKDINDVFDYPCQNLSASDASPRTKPVSASSKQRENR